MSFKEYLNQVRIEESKRLLANSSFSIINIAVSVGFEDQSYFSKYLKNIPESLQSNSVNLCTDSAMAPGIPDSWLNYYQYIISHCKNLLPPGRKRQYSPMGTWAEYRTRGDDKIVHILHSASTSRCFPG